MMTDGITRKEMEEVVNAYVSNMTSNAEALRQLSSDELLEKYLKKIVEGETDTAFLYGLALGIEELYMPEEYLPERNRRRNNCCDI